MSYFSSKNENHSQNMENPRGVSRVPAVVGAYTAHSDRPGASLEPFSGSPLVFIPWGEKTP